MKLPILATIAALLFLGACDNKHSGNAQTNASEDQSIPPEIAAAIEPQDALWLDAPFQGSGCPATPTDFPGVNFYYKKTSDPWPAMQSNGFIIDEHPLPLDPATRIGLKGVLVPDLVRSGFATQEQTNLGFGDIRYCLKLNEGRLGDAYASYKSGATEMRGLVNMGAFTFDHAEFISEFDKARAEGYVTKHRKYHLFAYVGENAAFGQHRFHMERYVVIYFDPENRVWQIDPYDQTNWTWIN